MQTLNTTLFGNLGNSPQLKEMNYQSYFQLKKAANVVNVPSNVKNKLAMSCLFSVLLFDNLHYLHENLLI